MEISITEQGVVFLFSCVVGGLLGAFYDIFRIIRIAFNSKWLSVFFQDLIFCIFSAFSIILLVFYTNSGRVRWFSLLGCFICFVLYHLTVGRIVIFMSKKIIDFIKRLLKFLYKITVIPVKITVLFILKQLKKLSGFMLRIFKKTQGNLYYGREKRKIAKDGSRGFGLYKNNSNINGKTAKNIGKIIEKDSAKSQKPLEKSKKKI
ncbi:MAG: spore cortex biosynthesis protein YabQ [Oscillospiraceae bacterium]|nr:spore cortex biosynthesis protein YabQ [Oscillospiraceae bacterium]